MSDKISICITGKNPHLWMRLYNSLKDNKCDFEIIIVGPNAPMYDHPLPYNFRYIKSSVKPSQCAQIAMNHAKGNILMMSVADDFTFPDPNALDKLLIEFNERNSPEYKKAVISCRFMLNGVDMLSNSQLFVVDKSVARGYMTIGALIYREFFESLGGYDNNFIATCFDMDMSLRIREAGGHVFLHGVFANESKPEGTTTFESSVWIHDRDYIEFLWSENRDIKEKRKCPVNYFSNTKDILLLSQGKRSAPWT